MQYNISAFFFFFKFLRDCLIFCVMRISFNVYVRICKISLMQHDIFLITKNAMHFNSSATIYFRQVRSQIRTKFGLTILLSPSSEPRISPSSEYFLQAREIDELAVRVFHVLKTHPESFELEFSESRRRNTRRSQGEAGNSLNRKRPKMARNVKPSSLVIDEPSKSMPCSLSTTSNIWRRNAERHVHSSSIPCSDARNYQASCGKSRNLIPCKINSWALA